MSTDRTQNSLPPAPQSHLVFLSLKCRVSLDSDTITLLAEQANTPSILCQIPHAANYMFSACLYKKMSRPSPSSLLPTNRSHYKSTCTPFPAYVKHPTLTLCCSLPLLCQKYTASYSLIILINDTMSQKWVAQCMQLKQQGCC
jgi:hypothetical protein